MPQSGPNFPGTVTDRNDGTGGSPAGGSWASITNVQADDGTVATWTKPATAGVVGDALELSSFGTFAGVGAGDTINFVRITIESTQANTTRMDPFQVQLWDGTTAQLGTTRTTTDSASAVTDTFDFTGVTFAQLANLRVCVRPMGATGNAQSSSGTVDFVSLTVDYTPPPAVAGDGRPTQRSASQGAGLKGGIGTGLAVVARSTLLSAASGLSVVTCEV